MVHGCQVDNPYFVFRRFVVYRSFLRICPFFRDRDGTMLLQAIANNTIVLFIGCCCFVYEVGVEGKERMV